MPSESRAYKFSVTYWSRRDSIVVLTTWFERIHFKADDGFPRICTRKYPVLLHQNDHLTYSDLLMIKQFKFLVLHTTIWLPNPKHGRWSIVLSHPSSRERSPMLLRLVDFLPIIPVDIKFPLVKPYDVERWRINIITFHSSWKMELQTGFHRSTVSLSERFLEESTCLINHSLLRCHEHIRPTLFRSASMLSCT